MFTKRFPRLIAIAVASTAVLTAGSLPATAAEASNDCRAYTEYSAQHGYRAVLKCTSLKINYSAYAELVVAGPIPNRYTREMSWQEAQKGVVLRSSYASWGERAIVHYKKLF